jgi:hypothetical protein
MRREGSVGGDWSLVTGCLEGVQENSVRWRRKYSVGGSGWGVGVEGGNFGWIE